MNAPVLKTGKGASPSWVRIPPSPPHPDIDETQNSYRAGLTRWHSAIIWHNRDLERHMRFILTIIVLLSCSQIAHGQSTKAKFAVIAAPVCTNNLGQQVQFETVASARVKSAAGMARRDDAGLPVVYRFGYEFSPPALQKFIDFHECAHHQTGDVDRPHPPRNSPEHMMNESIADCIAALRMRDEIDDGRSLLTEAILALTNAMTDAGFASLTTDSRVSNIENCMQKDTSPEGFINGVLMHRGLK